MKILRVNLWIAWYSNKIKTMDHKFCLISSMPISCSRVLIDFLRASFLSLLNNTRARKAGENILLSTALGKGMPPQVRPKLFSNVNTKKSFLASKICVRCPLRNEIHDCLRRRQIHFPCSKLL